MILNAMGLIASYQMPTAANPQPVVVLTPEAQAPQVVGQAFLPARVSVGYGVLMPINARLGYEHVTVATDAVAHTIDTPTGGRAGQVIEITIVNGTGGALGVATFGAGYNLGAAWVQPAAGLRRSIQFLFDGATWHEVGRTAADV